MNSNEQNEMQRKSSFHLQGNMPPAPNFVKINQHNSAQQSASNHPTPIKNEENKKESIGFGNSILNLLNINNLKIDNDIIIILMIMLLLSSSDADEILLLALVYIML